ncbi:leucine-rich_repeat protein [Hexamita inflata]|uniref:Leucine-rich repeat protein n=1 Tax=Hexamita inflata TaxID=28002 RepID=A0AA86REK9_9EUKA|nr:leucine-rich repeat protein [Hexamita inflata]
MEQKQLQEFINYHDPYTAARVQRHQNDVKNGELIIWFDSTLQNVDFTEHLNISKLIVDHCENVIISPLPHITELFLISCNLTTLNNLPLNIINLDITHNKITDLSVLSQIKTLKQLQIDGNKNLNLKTLNNNNITELQMNAIQCESLEGISQHTNLTKLIFNYNQISDLEPIKNMNKLNILWASSNKIVKMQPIKQLSQLKELLINNNKIQDLNPLTDLNMLEKLVLSANEIINTEPLRKMNQLLILDLAGNKITDLEPLRELVHMQELGLNFNRIINVKPLEKMIQLKLLNLYSNYIQNMNPILHLKIFENPNQQTLVREQKLPDHQLLQLNKKYDAVYASTRFLINMKNNITQIKYNKTGAINQLRIFVQQAENKLISQMNISATFFGMYISDQ